MAGTLDSLTVWVAVDDFGDGVPCGGPFASYDECSEWIGFEDHLEAREMPRGAALAALAETRRQADLRHEQWKANLAVASDPVEQRLIDLRIDRTLALKLARSYGADEVKRIHTELDGDQP